MSRRAAAAALARAAAHVPAPTLRHVECLAAASAPSSVCPAALRVSITVNRPFAAAAVVPPSRSADARPLDAARATLQDPPPTDAPPPPPSSQPPRTSPPPPTTWAQAGWTRASTLTLANTISAARLAASPAAYALIAHHQWTPALALVAVAGVSDWADGVAARRGAGGGVSVLGTYLDPLADKAFTCAAVAGGAAAGVLPTWLAGAVVARDAGLVAGAAAARWRAVGRRWPGGPEFFRLVPADGGDKDASTAERGEARATHTAPATAVRPLFVSKLNTALQFVTLAAALASPGLGWPDAGVVQGLAVATAATTAASGAAYGVQWARGGGVRGK